MISDLADSENENMYKITKISRLKLPRCRLFFREKYILDACNGKSVLHLGCSDYPHTREKYLCNELLHLKIGAVAKRVIGVDINAESINWLKSQGITDIHNLDANEVEALLADINFSPEVIVLGEILEHMSQPHTFLINVKAVMQEDTALVISIPNAFHFRGFIHTLFGREKTHPDHVAYYSYRTIHELLNRSKLKIEEIFPYRIAKRTLGQKLTLLIEAPLLLISPHLAPGYVLKARKNS